MSYSHLTSIERGKLDSYHHLGLSTREIGKKLGRHPSTIARELERNRVGDTYDAEEAQALYKRRREACRPRGKWSAELGDYVTSRLKLTWSPEQIAGREGLISSKTIYRWINDGKIAKGLTCLRQKGKRQNPTEKRGKFITGRSISERTEDINSRNTVGHWELDTLLSSGKKSKDCLATFAERKTRFYIATKIPDRTASSMKQAIKRVVGEFPKDLFKSATTDRGKEFACYREIEKELKIPIYFADPYSPWQRGTNENSNGLLREFIPKNTDLAVMSEEDLKQSIDLINHRPRKILGWKTPYEVLKEEVSHLV